MKFLRHPRDKVGDFQRRVLLHIPVGIYIGMTAFIPFVGSTFGRLFEEYQTSEDLRTADEAWKDLFGALVGFVIGSVVAMAIIGIVIWRIVVCLW